MEFLTKILTNQFNDPQIAGNLMVLLVFAATFCLIMGGILIINNIFDPVRSRFLSGKNTSVSLVGNHDEGVNIYDKYRHILLPSDQEQISRTMQRLNHAGYHFRRNLYQYYALRLLMVIALPLITLLILFLLPGIKLELYFQGAVLACVLGYVGPSFVLDHKITNRQKIIQRGFPDALDLLLVCSEAGLSLDAAIQKVAAEISFSQPVLAQELSLLIAEIRAGLERKKAFTNLADRTGVDDIRGLMSAINQSMRFGSSIAQTLRVYSADFRDKRMQAAEEKAAKIGAKLIFPTALCLLPCFILIIIVPFALNLIKVFSNL